MKHTLKFIVVLCAGLGIGALSVGTIQQIQNEFSNRSMRAANLHDMFAGLSKNAGDYFSGMSDGHFISASLLSKADPTTVANKEYFQGMAYALYLDSLTMAQAETTGTITPFQ